MHAIKARIRALDDLNRDVAFLCLAFALLRLWAVLGRGAVRYPDSGSYFIINLLGHASRLWAVPVFFTVLPSDGARVFAQIVIGIFCWSALAFAVAKSLKHPVVARIGALLGLCIQVTEWDQIILSESLALSLTALLAATLLWLRLQRSYWAISSVLVVSVLWIFTRQIQATVFIPVAVVAIVWILWRARRYLAVAVALALIAAWGGYATANGKAIIELGAHDILVLRVLQEPGAVTYFRRAGMPDVGILEKESAAYVASQRFVGGASPVFRDPSWTGWVDRHWALTYAEWLLRHPVADIRDPLAKANELLSGFPNYGTARPVLPAPVQDGLWERGTGDIPLWVVFALVLWIVSLRVRRQGSLDAVAAAGLAIAVFWYVATWHLGAGEQARHVLPGAAFLRIALFVFVLSALDRIVLGSRSGRAGRR